MNRWADNDIVIEKDMEEYFQVEDVGDGDEMMSVLPWKGAIMEPENPPPLEYEIPTDDYDIEFVYGVRTEEVRKHVHFNS